MRYTKLQDGVPVAYPYTISMLKLDHPHVSFPRTLPEDDQDRAELLAAYGVAEVDETPQPPSTTTSDFQRGLPALQGGRWTEVWVEVPCSPEEAVRRQAAATDAAHRQEIRLNAFVTNFIAMTPAQVAAYVENNVTNLASAKELLKSMAVMMLLLARREFKD